MFFFSVQVLMERGTSRDSHLLQLCSRLPTCNPQSRAKCNSDPNKSFSLKSIHGTEQMTAHPCTTSDRMEGSCPAADMPCSA